MKNLLSDVGHIDWEGLIKDVELLYPAYNPLHMHPGTCQFTGRLYITCIHLGFPPLPKWGIVYRNTGRNILEKETLIYHYCVSRLQALK